MTSADLSLSLWVYFYLRALEHEMMYQWRTCSPALWIKMTVGFFSGSSPQVRRKKHSCWSVFFVHTEGRESLRQAYIKLFFCHSLFFFIWGDITTGTKSLLLTAAILRNEFPIILQGCLLSSNIEMETHWPFFMFAVLQPTNHPMMKLKCVIFFWCLH